MEQPLPRPEERVYRCPGKKPPHPLETAYPHIDNDLALDNLENETDLTAADQQDG